MLLNMKMNNVVRYRVAASLVIVFSIALVFTWNTYRSDAIRDRIEQTSSSELNKIKPAIDYLVGSPLSSQREPLECSERSESPLKRNVWCQYAIFYGIGENEPAEESNKTFSSRLYAIDEAMDQNGWAIEGQKYDTIAEAGLGTINFYGVSEQITVSKPLDSGGLCRVKIDFQGIATESSQTGRAIDIVDFTCMGSESFFSPHIPQLTEQGFEPV
jgi:hypothetical protein